MPPSPHFKNVLPNEFDGAGTGWTPHHLQATLDATTIGVAPLYGKLHSQGEYIFDHNFAHAYENAGGSYYPKMQIAVPHTPATGRRLLVSEA
ncbi:MAG: peptidogalycan biosysnthesis protein, partial [Pseudomonadales bacterium]